MEKCKKTGSAGSGCLFGEKERGERERLSNEGWFEIGLRGLKVIFTF